MTLELKTVTAGTDDEESAELRNMTRRFWIGAGLALPVLSWRWLTRSAPGQATLIVAMHARSRSTAAP